MTIVDDVEQDRVAVPQPDRTKVPYRLAQPYGCLPEVIIKGALDLDATDADWIRQADGVDFKPLVFSASQGYFVNLLRVRRSGVLSRHRHAGPVHAFVLRGTWHYLEHDWAAEAGDYVCEPPGEVHTLVVPEQAGEMITLFHVTGGYVYVDPFGTALGYEDVFTKIQHARDYYEAAGRGGDYVDRFIR